MYLYNKPIIFVKSSRHTIAIIVRPDNILVRMPNRMPKLMARAFVHSKKDWIRQKINKMPLLAPYTIGEYHYFLGTAYPIIEHNHTFFFHKESLGTTNNIRASLIHYYKKQATYYLPPILNKMTSHFSINYPIPEILLTQRWMHRSWGMMRKEGKMTLNIQLMKAHPKLIEYVILHECAHMIEFNHGKQFYAVLKQVCPDYAIRRDTLHNIPLDTLPLHKK